MAGRAMIVGRARSHIVGAAHPYPELAEFTGADAYGRPYIVGAAAGDTVPAPVQPDHQRGVPVAYVRADTPQVIEKHPKDPREFPIGFQTAIGVPVPANTTVGIEQKPQVLFRGERLAVPNSIVLNFDVNDIKVGKDSQLASPGNMPSECFSNLSVGVRMQLDTAEPGITITLSMFNNDPNNPHAFKSVLYGTVIE
jgi:hypothetical protein